MILESEIKKMEFGVSGLCQALDAWQGSGAPDDAISQKSFFIFKKKLNVKY